MIFDKNSKIWKLPSATLTQQTSKPTPTTPTQQPGKTTPFRCPPCTSFSYAALCSDTQLEDTLYPQALLATTFDENLEGDIDVCAMPGNFGQLPPATQEASKDERRKYLAFKYQQEAMDLHRSYGHPSAAILTQSLEHNIITHKHLIPYINKLQCECCLMMHGHRVYRMEKRISTKRKMPVEMLQEDMPDLKPDQRGP
jgi:hypothetical protein